MQLGWVDYSREERETIKEKKSQDFAILTLFLLM